MPGPEQRRPAARPDAPNLDVIGAGLRRTYAVVGDPAFGDLLRAIDAADRPAVSARPTRESEA